MQDQFPLRFENALRKEREKGYIDRVLQKRVDDLQENHHNISEDAKLMIDVFIEEYRVADPEIQVVHFVSALKVVTTRFLLRPAGPWLTTRAEIALRNFTMRDVPSVTSADLVKQVVDFLQKEAPETIIVLWSTTDNVCHKIYDELSQPSSLTCFSCQPSQAHSGSSASFSESGSASLRCT